VVAAKRIVGAAARQFSIFLKYGRLWA